MTSSASGLPKGLKIGSTMVIVAALVPLMVAPILFVSFLIGVANPSEPWLSGKFPPGPASYSLQDIQKFNPSLAADYVTAQHIELAQAINNAALILLLAIFGLRRSQKWSWYVILATYSWLGINDLWAMVASKQSPVPLIPILVGISGLLIARSSIFARQ
jgi:hypothetical protein